MRHLGSLVAALVITPLAWVLLALGQPRAGETFSRWGEAETIRTGQLLPALGFLIGAGVLIGLVACLRWSPLGPLVAGTVLLGVYGYLLVRPFPLLDRLPVWRVGDLRVDCAVPLENGTLAALGAALVVATVSGQRWRRWPTATQVPEAPAPGTGAELYRPASPAHLDAYPGAASPTVDATGLAQPAGGGVGTAVAEQSTTRTEEPVTGAGLFLTRGAAERLRTAETQRPAEPARPAEPLRATEPARFTESARLTDSVPEPRVPEQVSPGWPVWGMPAGDTPSTAEDLPRRTSPDLPRRTPTPADAPGTIAAAAAAVRESDPDAPISPGSFGAPVSGAPVSGSPISGAPISGSPVSGAPAQSASAAPASPPAPAAPAAPVGPPAGD
ncbi:hypothetical protein, partial [Virgisporangium aliadipatigenens]|uniref:hypothetical protein n=1 Tax=Virgisporangium aliadipatigenens TaxID=741659 RepID=UPI0019404E05